MLLPTSLILSDGTILTGQSFGAHTDSEGEVVFNTGMTGYPESFTDPSYKGQILTLTYPLIGNYGVPDMGKDKDRLMKFFESEKIHLRGVIVSEYSENFSHWSAKKSLGSWLKEFKIPGITGIDTRALTQKIREKGTMLGRIIAHKEKNPNLKFTTFRAPDLDNVVAEVSIKKITTYKRGRKHVALIDTGCKTNIIREFLKRDITVTRFPWNANPFESKTKFDGMFFSNGPGDPMLPAQTHETMRLAISKNLPTFGICLGCQIMGIAEGAKTYKLKYGHR
ncbi:MAG: glutamine-hydrolyzing carbamoyl-phosphate synthase small subunit, partial [Candidatus Gracilibacteria bacterium]